MTTTANIMNEFASIIDTDKVYDLKEMKSILEDIYKNKTKKIKKSGEKKAPSSYNNFIGSTIKKMRVEDPSLSAKDAMSKAGALWKGMSDEEKNSYKS